MKKSAKLVTLAPWIVMALLGIALVLTNIVMYRTYQGQQITSSSDTQAFVYQQVQINQLRACIDAGIKPCPQTPSTYSAPK